MTFLIGKPRKGAHLAALVFFAFAVALPSPPLLAQEQTAASDAAPAPRGTSLSLGAFKVSADMPIEVVSDELQMDQNVNTAVFTGNVEVIHGDMTLNSATVLVEYGKVEGSNKSNEIIRITASGGVIMTSPDTTAESREAVYTMATREVVMSGDVVVTQGPNKVAGEQMVIYLDDGTAVMQGRVHTTIDTSKPQNTDSEASSQ